MDDQMMAEIDDVAEGFRAAMRAFAATVTIVTTSDGVRRHGMTASAVTSLSMDPPSLLVCANRNSLLHDIMFQARHFTVNILSADQESVAAAFAGGVSPEERFNIGAWEADAQGIPYLGNAQSALFCRKAAAIPFGTHTIIVGTVEKVLATSGTLPLVYQGGKFCNAWQSASAAAS